MLKYEVIKSLHELEPYQKDWSNILEEFNNDNPFVEYEWISTWWEILGRSHPVEIYVVKNDDDPVAFFPFEHSKRFGIHQYQFIGSDEAFYMEVISSPQWLEKSIQYLFTELEKKYGRVLFDLNGLLESKDTSNLIEKFAIEKQYPHSIFRVVTPFINFNETSYQQLINRSKRKIKEIDRREKKLKSLGNLTYKTNDEKHLEEMFRLYENRWRKKLKKSNFSSYPMRKFYETLIGKRNHSFRVEINYLYFEDCLIGFTYYIYCRGRKVGVKKAHESDFNMFGPGRLIEKESLASKDYSLYDFGRGYEQYKLMWSTNLDFTRKILMSSKGKREKYFRIIRSATYFLKWKISTSGKYGMFKRDKLGELFHFTSIKEKVASIRNLISSKLSIIEIYKLEENNLKKSESSFIELKIQDVLHKNIRKQLIPYYYRGYRIFSEDGQTISYKRHDQTIRDEDTGFIEQLPPNSIFIKDYKESEILKIVCELGSEKCSICTVVNRFSLKKRKILKSIGFKKVKQIPKLSFNNWRKVIRKQTTSRN